jgi:hypothetical protein
MSIVVEVRFPSGRLPTPQVWQDSIVSNNFAVEIDSDFDPVTFKGFLPARYQGQPAGFEYYYDPGADGKSCVSLVWAGRIREAVSGIIAAACLCHLTKGYLIDTEAGETIEAPSAIDWARHEESGFQQMITEENMTPVKKTKSKVKPWWRFW